MSSTPQPPRKIPFALRTGIFFLGVLLTFLFGWLLSFLIQDISRIDGPDRYEIIEAAVDPALSDQKNQLTAEIAKLEQASKREQEIQKNLKRSMENARDTMKQMMDLHRLSLERQSPPSETEKQALATAQQRFLDAQNKFEESNTRITDSSQQRYEREQTLEQVEADINKQEEPAWEEYYRQNRRHQFKLAGLKLLVIVPLFLLSLFLLYRFRKTAYRPVLIAALVATGYHLVWTMHLHFPNDFFKYIAVLVGIVASIWSMVWLLRKALRPDRNLLLKRYREAYRGHTCPICDYPIARGPIRFARWTRKGPVVSHRTAPGEVSEDVEPYACPSCGTGLFESCTSCNKSRHSLLPFCEHCGDEWVAAAESP